MAAPTGTTWGSVVGDYGRIGLYINVTTNNNTTYAGEVQVWFWSKYSVSDSGNALYFDNLAAAGSATTSRGSYSVKTTNDSGGWASANQIKLASYSFSYTKGTTAVTRYAYAKLANIDRVGGTMYASKSFSVPALPSYTVSYNANGGSGAPSAQTKTYGKSLTLSTTKPTRTGYTFKGWATSASGSVAYASGASYTANSGATLYAVWQANTYTVSYDANGGTGAPSAQTKTYGTTLKLSSTKPTRTNYNFLGWATSATATTATYAAGANYTTNAAVKLYAVWELAYTKPIIVNLSASRCDSDGTPNENGSFGLIKFDWKISNSVTLTGINIIWESASGSGSKAVTATGQSGENITAIIGGNLPLDVTYKITVEVIDNIDSNNANTTLNGAVFPFDAVKTEEGIGAAVGKPAEKPGVFDVAFDAEFKKPVYGNVLGLNKLPAIPEGAELNDYLTTGAWAIYSNAVAATITCGGVLLGTNDSVPPARACRFEVNASTGEGIRAEQYSYLRQRFIPYNDTNPIFERDVTRSADNIWRYYDWWRSSLTPAASQKVYSKAAITLGLNANSTMSVASTYTKIPFNSIIATLSDRLTLSENSVRIGEGIDFVKASANLLIKSGSVAASRHFRIQKISNGTTTSHAWTLFHAGASSNTVYTFTPVIIPVKEGDLIRIVYYTTDTADEVVSGNTANGRQSYLTVEEL